MPRKNHRKREKIDNRRSMYSKQNACSDGQFVHSDTHTGADNGRNMTTEEQMKQTAVLVGKYTKRLTHYRKSGQGRHKAHSNNKRKDRAISTIYRMLKSADQTQRKMPSDSYLMITG